MSQVHGPRQRDGLDFSALAEDPSSLWKENKEFLPSINRIKSSCLFGQIKIVTCHSPVQLNTQLERLGRTDVH